MMDKLDHDIDRIFREILRHLTAQLPKYGKTEDIAAVRMTLKQWAFIEEAIRNIRKELKENA